MSLRTSLSGIVAGHDLKVAERTVRRTSLRTPDETKRTGVRIRSFDKDGNRIMADRSAALKALELQGRHLAMFTDKQKVDANHNITWPLPKHPLE